MSEMKHTQGPWVQGDGDPEHILCASSWACVATVNTSLSYWEAIARLIAAAPDLLEALLLIADMAVKGRHEEDFDAIESKARAAIAKAQGDALSFLERRARFLQSGKRGDGT